SEWLRLPRSVLDCLAYALEERLEALEIGARSAVGNEVGPCHRLQLAPNLEDVETIGKQRIIERIRDTGSAKYEVARVVGRKPIEVRLRCPQSGEFIGKHALSDASAWFGNGFGTCFVDEGIDAFQDLHGTIEQGRQ